jgi:hypothetical protein
VQGTISLNLGQIMVAESDYDHHCFYYNYIHITHVITITGNLDLLEPSRPLQAFNGIAFTFTVQHIWRTYYVKCRAVCLSRILIRR